MNVNIAISNLLVPLASVGDCGSISSAFRFFPAIASGFLVKKLRIVRLVGTIVWTYLAIDFCAICVLQ